MRFCVLFLFLFVFFFKQKTAYEMRISDWSSDVCSSDLRRWSLGAGTAPGDRPRARPELFSFRHHGGAAQLSAVSARRDGKARGSSAGAEAWPGRGCQARQRSEEHTSELQSLMRISYAVFCLKKKKKKKLYTTSNIKIRP